MQPEPTSKKTYKIVVLDDSEFYNRLLTRQLENYTMSLAMENNCHFEIISCSTPEDCFVKEQHNVHIAFIDYYLGKGITGSDMIKEIKQQWNNCTVVIISQSYSIKTALQTITEGAVDFILKDKNALSKCCFVVNDYVHGRLSTTR